MKTLLLAITTLITSVAVFAQSDEGLFEVEYEMNGQDLKSFAFSTDNCAQSLIVKSWENWVTNKEGASGFLKKHEANNIKFKNSQDVYKSVISLVEEENGKTTVINTLTDQNGMTFNSHSAEFDLIYNQLQDLAVKTKQSCVRTELKLANENMIRLTKENADAQIKKGSSIKSYLKNSNTLLKLESKKQALGDKLDLVVNQLERESDDKMMDGLMKKKIKTENALRTIEDQVVSLNGKIQIEEDKDKGLDAKINQLTTQIQQQRLMSENLKKKYSSIAR
ncbi:hypothetical protein NZD85_12480 [Empedobacter stercoris]|uniref:hypothetical protein n=1 Tax=Empedobacter TaxID=59734 RepID=UPI0016628BE5|nr:MULTISPECIES: hypothetical protein [Empedobacter]HJD86576.1 hypothetical protein [Empedobacter falsenii]MCA4809331.1 hypothetical protein [Empedobacter stercoris]MDM1522707.1 hypothetical protein [Empedobacter sp. 225-1]MDM1543802.1 hypothetical protein [Empedobacter sp. 189-2]QNT14799.1 hypothetical protein HNV03_09080 [Empedobacter stercoris]